MKKTPKAAKVIKRTKSITTPAFKEILGLLYKYELKYGTKFHLNSNTPKAPHWFKVELWSDGSGNVKDSSTKEVLFRFDNIKELEGKLKV